MRRTPPTAMATPCRHITGRWSGCRASGVPPGNTNRAHRGRPGRPQAGPLALACEPGGVSRGARPVIVVEVGVDVLVGRPRPGQSTGPGRERGPAEARL